MYKKLELCPSCENSGFNNLLIAKDNLVSHESFAIVECQRCRLLFTNPRPNDSRLANYYNSNNYISHNDKKISIQNILYRIVRKITINQKIKLIKKYHPSGKLLDYGTGSGAFLRQAVKHFGIKGIEPNKRAIKQAPSSIKKDIYENIDQIKSDHKFDIITMWHVLEHLPNLKITFNEIKNLLSSKGHLFIAVPNPNSWDSKQYGAKWAGYDVPRHLYHFNRNTLSYFLKQYGLRIVDIKSMKFDAYYISMLTEKYRKNPYSFIRGLFMGYRSNQSASLNGEYSSLLYIVSI